MNKKPAPSAIGAGFLLLVRFFRRLVKWLNDRQNKGYLTKHDIIDPTDIRWMPPTVLRDALASGKVKPAPGSDVEPQSFSQFGQSMHSTV